MFLCRNLLRSVLHIGVLLAQKLTVRAGQRQMVAHGGRCGGFIAVFQGLADGLVSGARQRVFIQSPGFLEHTLAVDVHERGQRGVDVLDEGVV